jgi:ParB family chromosome partitioning protein
LDALDQAEFLAARKRVYENAHPETRKGIVGAKARWDATANLAVASFVKATAEATGLSERNIQRRAMVGERLSRADIRMLREASTRIKATDLEALAKIGEPIVRSDVIGRLASGEVKSVSEALEKIQPQKAKVSDLDGKALQTLATAWERAPMKVKRRFIADQSADLLNLLKDLDGEL